MANKVTIHQREDRAYYGELKRIESSLEILGIKCYFDKYSNLVIEPERTGQVSIQWDKKKI